MKALVLGKPCMVFVNQNALMADVDEASAVMNSFARGAYGLVPECIRTSDQYIEASRKYNEAFQALRAFNEGLTSNQKRQMAKARRANR